MHKIFLGLYLRTLKSYMAVKNNKITKELIFHSDRGTQYASYRFTKILKSYNGLVKQSMSRKGNCWDNAIAESFFKRR